MGPAWVRGWRNTVGNLVELVVAPSYRYMRKTQGGTVSSNSRFQTVLVQQYSANLSMSRVPCTSGVLDRVAYVIAGCQVQMC